MKNFAAMTALFLAMTASAYDTIRFKPVLKDSGMVEPVAAAWSPGRIYVLDAKKSSLLIFEAGGQTPGALIKAVGGKGSGNGQFSSPRGVAVGPGPRIYVADTGNSRVQIFDAEGTYLSSFGSQGSAAGELKRPESLAVAGDGRVYVADTGNDRIQVFTREGIFLHGFGTSGKGPGELRGPSKVAVDLADNVFILDSGNERLAVFDATAHYARELPIAGTDFAMDGYGFFYVLKAGENKVFEHRPDGKIAGKFGNKGGGEGQLKKAEGVAVGEGGEILVLDTGNSRVLRVELVNKLKLSLIEPSLATKLVVSGPAASWPVKAEALAVLNSETLYAYLPEEGRFAVFDAFGKEKQDRFGTKAGKTPATTRGSRGFAASRLHGLFVSDTPGNRIQLFSLEGAWKRNMAEKEGFFESGKKEGRVRDPHGVAINESGSIYVADTGNRRVDTFSPEGVFLSGIGPSLGEEELSEPNALAWDEKGFLYFSDRGLKKVFKVEPSGALLTSFGGEGDSSGKFRRPASMAYDGRDYVYVLDSDLKRVSVFSRFGGWVTDLFSGGKGELELEEPEAIAVMGSRLMIADSGRGRIVGFDLRPSLAPPVSLSTRVAEGRVELSWSAAPEAWAKGVMIYRSTLPAGPYQEVARAEKSPFKDSGVVAFERYFYRLASEAATGDIGPQGPAVEVFVPGAFNKSNVEISSVAIGNIFSANYKWYLKNPMGSAVLKNNVNLPYERLKLSFRLKDFMDFSTDSEIEKLGPQETVELPLRATLNNKILEVSEDTPIQAELTLTYFESGKHQSVSLAKPLRVYSRNAITWDIPERIANFITPKDPPVLDFARGALRDAPASWAAESLNANLATAMQLWTALSEQGVSFFSPPNNPYEKVSEDPNFPVDYTQFPRETLKRNSGECDDLVTMIAAMLEGARVRTALLDYPGHLAMMFDSESNDPIEVGIPEKDLIRFDDTLWVPLETTLIGKSFAEARAKAAYAYRTESEKGKVKIIDVRKAWSDYEPASMPPAEDIPPPAAAARQRRFEADASAAMRERYEFLAGYYEGLLKSDSKDVDSLMEFALLEYQSGHKDKGVEGFRKVLALDPANAAALNNLGNVEFLRGDMKIAESLYLKAVSADATDPDVWMNLVKTQVKLKNKDKAREYAEKAVSADDGLKPAVETLLKGL